MRGGGVKVFVYEFVTGGGLVGEALSPGLVHEADLMVRSLLDDLGDVPGVACVTTRDPRLPPVAGADTLAPLAGEGPLDLYRRGVSAAEWVWPTAPETGGMLEHLACLALAGGRGLLGSRPDAVKLTASKYATVLRLEQAGVPVVPTFRSHSAALCTENGPWVVKPDDGAGAEDTLVVADRESAFAHLAQLGSTHVAQPWLEGIPASLSLLCSEGTARIIACNLQQIRVTDGRVLLGGIDVNGGRSWAPELEPLAGRIAAAIPGLWGYVGVDLLLTPDGPVVLEINPRLTTSWCGLRQALGVNPARWVIELARTGVLPQAPLALAGGIAHLDLEPTGVG
jgi:tyramine---L-glutamate ligase